VGGVRRLVGLAVTRPPPPPREGLQFNDRQLAELIGGLEYLLKTVRGEVDARPMFIMPPGAVDLLEQRAPAFGPEVQDAFPSSENDVAEAARCLAMQRYTACVTHLMRALEVPLDALARSCGVEAKSNWNKLLNDIEAKIRERRSDRNAVAEQWMAEAATQFRFIKNAWRNHAMHARGSYDEAQARDIYGSGRGFLQQRAAHLNEEPTDPAGEP
jgi:hypothetical protein